ncbi:phosphoribosyltransferase [Legionella jamestowniensis]|uniref:Hypoxanthine-guanine phosphoribosyltransferase n=1 Tax=Legionella jamestowniensis TaxID=455 RepID=A0A0W0UGC6_9GAMM|nr:phosphoribosyltransferase family protein [Legionella jamestowniensis]KTD06933.1 hypoxanthine-guanine phosphoribosyltransferase [Legionella jamestowniensis]OCH97455.1 hypothetical protein A8135_02985 [Legionella jamestowniensis]SFL84907.1 hypoxanthine phosphoribosyltransferase [Legionella jamestowniensis DSM 19215]
MSKDEILKKLRTIQKLKEEITERVWQNARPIQEIDEEKFNKKGEALTERAIEQRTVLLAERLIKEYRNANPVLISLMDGAHPFASLLQTTLNKFGYKYSYTTMQASSYGNQLTSGELKISSMPKINLGERTVFIIDDICDTGKTYLKIKELLENFGPKQISLIVLVEKVQPRINNYRPEYVGFEIPPDAFVVGMGLDYYGELRNKTEIRGVDPASLPSREEQELLDSEASLNEELRKLIALEKTTKPGSSTMTVFGGNKSKDRVDPSLTDSFQFN